MKLYICRICGQDAHTFTQPALVPGRKPALQIECRTADCPNWKLTTDRRDTALVDQRFTVQPVDTGDDPTLEFLQRRVRSLVLLSGRGHRPTLERLKG